MVLTQERLISETESRPTTWNIESREYSNKNEKSKDMGGSLLNI
jgi:hypothetical protein